MEQLIFDGCAFNVDKPNDKRSHWKLSNIFHYSSMHALSIYLFDFYVEPHNFETYINKWLSIRNQEIDFLHLIPLGYNRFIVFVSFLHIFLFTFCLFATQIHPKSGCVMWQQIPMHTKEMIKKMGKQLNQNINGF